MILDIVMKRVSSPGLLSFSQFGRLTLKNLEMLFSKTFITASDKIAGLQIRVCTRKLFFLFLNQNICCGYSKERHFGGLNPS